MFFGMNGQMHSDRILNQDPSAGQCWKGMAIMFVHLLFRTPSFLSHMLQAETPFIIFTFIILLKNGYIVFNVTGETR